MSDSDYKSCYLIQHETNGYVHAVFDNIGAARQWMYQYESRTDESRSPYIIIQRRLCKFIDDIDHR